MKASLLLATFCLPLSTIHADDLLPPITTGQRVAT